MIIVSKTTKTTPTNITNVPISLNFGDIIKPVKGNTYVGEGIIKTITVRGGGSSYILEIKKDISIYPLYYYANNTPVSGEPVYLDVYISKDGGNTWEKLFRSQTGMTYIFSDNTITHIKFYAYDDGRAYSTTFKFSIMYQEHILNTDDAKIYHNLNYNQLAYSDGLAYLYSPDTVEITCISEI